ncbi:3-oxoadipate CoA-transferase subunit A [archaeon HR06]|nr:3-oxoadipate CoA-transferase subunit A [archaeon HR06]
MVKFLTLKEAIKLVKDNSLVGIGGISLSRRPMSLVREIIRQGKKNLTILSFIGGLPEDMLIASDCVKKVRSSYIGFEIFGFAPNFKRYVEEGKVEVIEESEYSIIAGLEACIRDLPFMHTKALLGSDILKVRKDLKIFKCPITNETLVAIPPIKPDIALIHAQKADKNGNILIEGTLGIDIELAKAADLTIVSVEEIVSKEYFIKNIEKTKILREFIDVVVEAPKGALPTSCYPIYKWNLEEIIEYIELCEENKIKDYLDKHVYNRAW